MSDSLSLLVTNIITVTLTDPLTSGEGYKIVSALKENGFESTVSKSNRILTVEVESLDDLEIITAELAELGLVESIGLIRQVTEFEPQWDHNMIRIEFD